MFSQTHMQVDVRIPAAKVFFQARAMFFPPLFKYHVLHQNQSEVCIGEDDIWVAFNCYAHTE